MIAVGDFIVDSHNIDILYFVKSKVHRHNSFILMPVCSIINNKFRKEFDGDVTDSDRIITINDLINMKYIHNYGLMNKAMEYLIERHRL